MYKNKDERILNEYNKIASKMFWVITLLLFILMTYKIFTGKGIELYVIELLCFSISIPYVLITKLVRKILFVKNPDKYLKSISNGIYTSGFMIDVWIILIGGFILITIDDGHTNLYSLYILVFIIPSLILTIYSIKNGWLIWGGSKRKSKGKLALKKKVILVALFYGITMHATELFKEGNFHSIVLVRILVRSLGWGIPFYFMFSLMVDKGEKNADNQLEIEEKYCEKQENENS